MSIFAVVDTETTGLSPYQHDRVVEVAVVLVRPGHGITDEFSTLVNPERDVGPTRIHGITATDVLNAPRFSEVVQHLAARLRPCVALVGHCVVFDAMFLRAEFERIGLIMPDYPTIDTRRIVGGGTLTKCCADHGIDFGGKTHAALYDARATARLFERLVTNNPAALASHEPFTTLDWPEIPFPGGTVLPRGESAKFASRPSPYLQRLIERRELASSVSIQTERAQRYLELLDRVLEDRHLEEVEATALTDAGSLFGLTSEQVETIHVAYLSDLAGTALADGHVTDGELHELQLVSHLLGFGNLSHAQLSCLVHDRTLIGLRQGTPDDDSLAGRSVCFTGEGQCSFGGVPISRARAEAMARAKGLVVQESVTKKLDLLVAADPNTQSRKMNKARQYGVRVVHERVFWRNLGVTID